MLKLLILQNKKEYSNEKVIYKLQEVNFFPEEVTKYSPFIVFNEAIKGLKEAAIDPQIEKPHPDFGYDPYKTIEKQYFRYRLLLFPIVNENIEYELFKFKFPLLFYPIQFFIDKESFSELSALIENNEDKPIMANNEEELYTILSAIIKSESTLRLIRRLMAI